MADVLVVGSGLIGASLGLALRSTHDVALTDLSDAAARAASRRGAGRVWDGLEPSGVVVVCAPPRVTAAEINRLSRLDVGQTYTHVSSVQAPVQAEIEAMRTDLSSVCGGHPLAGRERSGPEAATGELFDGRTWAVCPSAATSERARRDVEQMAEATGARCVVLDALGHDRAVALVSHLPQVAASALAARLLGGPNLAERLAGPGLQDSTRVAASNADLWTEILSLSARHLAPLVRQLAEDLDGVARALSAAGEAALDPPGGRPGDPHRRREGDPAAVLRDLLVRGAAGRERVPVKRGERDAAFVVVAVSVPDEPGQLARLLTAAGAGGVNVEDVRVEHSPDSPRGVIELLVRPAARDEAVAVLRAEGWDVLGSTA